MFSICSENKKLEKQLEMCLFNDFVTSLDLKNNEIVPDIEKNLSLESLSLFRD